MARYDGRVGEDGAIEIVFRKRGPSIAPDSVPTSEAAPPDVAAPLAAQKPEPVEPSPIEVKPLTVPAEGAMSKREVYQRALDLAAAIYTVVELAEPERYYLRDQLDRKSTAIPVLISRALATTIPDRRRRLFQDAARLVLECSAILDVLTRRGTVEPEAVEAASGVARELVGLMAPFCDRWALGIALARELPY